MNEIQADIFDQIKKSYRTINPTLSELLTVDRLTGKEADSLESQLKKVNKQQVCFIIMTAIGFVSLTVFTFIDLLNPNPVNTSLGLLAILTLISLVITYRLRIFIKSIENQIYLHRLLDKINVGIAANKK